VTAPQLAGGPRCAVPGCAEALQGADHFVCTGHWKQLPLRLRTAYRLAVRRLALGRSTADEHTEVKARCVRSLTPPAKGGAA
jgi:hypothetical protein